MFCEDDLPLEEKGNWKFICDHRPNIQLTFLPHLKVAKILKKQKI